ncbi:MAG TPA: ATP-binding cassette domain-containing protein [Microbacteriaceae bacterium]|nr:ATP-binding cassette domain-containing protein [Microbacteriaceae bacterium]
MPEVNKEADPAVKVSDLALGFSGSGARKGFRAVDGLQFEVKKGATLSVLGESGSGKSTLVKFLAGRAGKKAQKKDQIKHISGEAWTLEAPLHKLSRAQQRKLTAFVGFLEQDAGAKLEPELNVGDILFRPIEERIKRFDRSELGERVAEIFDSMALPLTFLQKYPYELSKGQRQRVAVARSLLTEPAVFIADEPTLGVDANNRPRIIDAISNFQKKTGSTLIVVSHDISMLEALSTEVLVLQQGNAVGYGGINEIFKNADHGYVHQLAQALRATAYDEVGTE